MLSKIEDSIKENQRNEKDMKALCEELKSKEKELDLKIIEQKKGNSRIAKPSWSSGEGEKNTWTRSSDVDVWEIRCDVCAARNGKSWST